MPPSRNDIRNDNDPISPPRNDIRNDNSPPAATCPVCAAAFTPIRRQRYCTPACRQAAWRARHPSPAPPPSTTDAARTTRRDDTVYQCGECGSRYLARQWCHDCSKPCTRLDAGGLCPHCDEPITIKDITDQHEPGRQRTDQHKPRHPATRPRGG
jgi:hypothetical protein